MKKGSRLGLVLLGVSLVTPAMADVVTVGGTVVPNEGQVSSVAGATTINFDTLSPGGPMVFTSGIASYSNLFIRQAATPDIVGDTSPFADPNSTIGDLTVTFSRPIIYFGLYWGSPDPLNTISFYNGATLDFSYTGQELNTQLGVGLGDGNAAYVNFAAGAGESWTKIIISADGSFPVEDDNQAYIVATPEPSSSLLLGILFVLSALTVKRAGTVSPPCK